MILALLLLLSQPVTAQSSTDTLSIPIADQMAISNIRKEVGDIREGRARITGLPTFANGIKFADGTIQTTASASTGSLTVPLGSTISVAGGANFDVMVSSLVITKGVAVTTASFTVPSGSVDFSSSAWTINYVAVSTNAVHYYLNFNGIATLSYLNQTSLFLSGGLGALSATSSGCLLDGGSGGVFVAANTTISGVIRFETVVGSSVTVLVRGESAMSNFNSNTPAGSKTHCSINLAAVPSTIQLTASTVADTTAAKNVAGTISAGYFTLTRGQLHP